jgi:hypothetical protein
MRRWGYVAMVRCRVRRERKIEPTQWWFLEVNPANQVCATIYPDMAARFRSPRKAREAIDHYKSIHRRRWVSMSNIIKMRYL